MVRLGNMIGLLVSRIHRGLQSQLDYRCSKSPCVYPKEFSRKDQKVVASNLAIIFSQILRDTANAAGYW